MGVSAQSSCGKSALIAATVPQSGQVKTANKVPVLSVFLSVCLSVFEPSVRVHERTLKEHVALDRSSWSLKSVCYKMHMGRKML